MKKFLCIEILIEFALKKKGRKNVVWVFLVILDFLTFL